MRAQIKSDFFDPPRPRVIAHRGASGDYPENTLPAFEAARDLGAPYIELDLHMTSDGHIVVAHDDNLERVSGVAGEISAMTLAELARFDAARNFTPHGRAEGVFPFRGRAVHVSELAEVFAACPAQRFILEIKQTTPSLVDNLIGVIDRAGLRRRVLVASEHQAPIDEFRAAAPDIPTNFPTPEVAAFMMSLAPGAPPFEPLGVALQMPPDHESWQLVTPEAVAVAHRLGVEIHVWTIDDETAMRAMLEAGVDGIITNYPARLLALLASR